MTRLLAYLRDRDVRLLALTMAWKRVLERHLSTERERPLKVDSQLRLELEAK